MYPDPVNLYQDPKTLAATEERRAKGEKKTGGKSPNRILQQALALKFQICNIQIHKEIRRQVSAGLRIRDEMNGIRIRTQKKNSDLIFDKKHWKLKHYFIL